MNYEEYRKKLEELYPHLSDEERKEILRLRYDFWKGIIDNYKSFIKK